jgi:hypothetical protein
VLGQIPGVREVISSVALGETEPNRYRYRWQVRLASEAALAQLRYNAAFQHFAKRYFDTFSTALVSSSSLYRRRPEYHKGYKPYPPFRYDRANQSRIHIGRNSACAHLKLPAGASPVFASAACAATTFRAA